jgi:hypothetical protein
MKHLYVKIEMTKEQWESWSDGYTDPIDPLCDIATAIDSSVTGIDVDNTTVWGSLEDFLQDNLLDSLASVPKKPKKPRRRKGG